MCQLIEQNLSSDGVLLLLIKQEQADVFRSVDSWHEPDIHAWILVLLRKPNYGDMANLCYTDTDSSIVYVIFEDVYKIFARDVDKISWYVNPRCWPTTIH